MVFSRVRCSSPLARSSPLGAHRTEVQKSRQFRDSCASGTRLTYHLSCYPVSCREVIWWRVGMGFQRFLIRTRFHAPRVKGSPRAEPTAPLGLLRSSITGTRSIDGCHALSAVVARPSTLCVSGLRTSAWRMITRPCQAGRWQRARRASDGDWAFWIDVVAIHRNSAVLIPRATKSIRRFCRHRLADLHPGRNWRGRSPGTQSPRQSPQARPDAPPALALRAVAAPRPLPPCLRCGSVRD
jgi:hypothetical protein